LVQRSQVTLQTLLVTYETSRKKFTIEKHRFSYQSAVFSFRFPFFVDFSNPESLFVLFSSLFSPQDNQQEESSPVYGRHVDFVFPAIRIQTNDSGYRAKLEYGCAFDNPPPPPALAKRLQWKIAFIGSTGAVRP
jgi:hypothetical protein